MATFLRPLQKRRQFYGIRLSALLCESLVETFLTQNTKIKNIMHAPTDVTCSMGFGGTISIKPWPLINDEKLETQNGIMNSLNVCQ
ncbi:hypothetical protein [Alcanivorax profundi]|uniref:hypothetical protein n=1 Tax=Alcanivorax profundi TaxID=2338368 RepID=UPI0032B2E1AE